MLATKLLALNKLKSAIKNKLDVVLRLSSNKVDNSDDENNLRKAFASYLSDTKLSKTQFSRIIQSGEFLGRLLAHY